MNLPEYTLSFIQLLGGLILSFGGIFQIVKLVKVKESKEFSLIWIWLAFFGILLMEIYAIGIFINLDTWGFLASNSLALLLQLTLLCLVMRYRK